MGDQKTDKPYMGMGALSPGDAVAPQTTIVGGQPDQNRTGSVQTVPVGLEQVLFVAAGNAPFREALLRDKAAAVEGLGFELTPSEKAVLEVAPRSQLRLMIDRMDTSHANLERRDFMRAVAGTLVTLAAGTGAAGCDNSSDKNPAPQKPEQPPAPVAPKTHTIDEPPRKYQSYGLTPDLPADKPAEPAPDPDAKEPDAGAPSPVPETPRPPSNDPPVTPEKKRAIAPPSPSKIRGSTRN